MEKGYIRVYCGAGKGKSDAALGRALVCASEGKMVYAVQFLKGCLIGKQEYFNRLEPELKIFRFEKEACYYDKLTEQKKKDAHQNIINGMNFVRKVLSIGECDVLVLDEILGLVDLGIIAVDEVVKLIHMKDETVELILTGRDLPEEVAACADYVSEFDIIKDEIPCNS